MKKRFKALILSALMLLSVFSFAGCKEEEKDQPQQTVQTFEAQEIGSVMDGNRVLVNSFEYFERDIMLIRVINRFGKLEQNRDKKFIHSGDNSLHVVPMGKRGEGIRPWISIPLSSVRFTELNFSDFTNVDKISMWVYNDNEEAGELGFGFPLKFYLGGGRFDSGTRTIMDYVTINPGWNFVEFDFNASNYFYCKPSLDLSAFRGLVLDFDPNPEYELETAKDYYIDDICLTYGEPDAISDPFSGATKGVKEDGTEYWLINDFENSNEKFLWDERVFGSSEAYVRTSNPIKFGTTATSGSQALEVRYNNRASYAMVDIHGSIIARVMDEIGQDLLDNPTNYEIKIDCYNTTDSAVTVSARSTNNPNGQFTAIANEWTTYSVSCERFVKNMSYSPDNVTPAKDTPGIEVLRQTNFGFMINTKFTDVLSKTLLFDNFRIEKIATA